MAHVITPGSRVVPNGRFVCRRKRWNLHDILPWVLIVSIAVVAVVTR